MDLVDLFNQGLIDQDELMQLTEVALEMGNATGISYGEASRQLASLADTNRMAAAMAQAKFVDDEKEPTDEEVAIHLSEMDALEQALTHLEES